MGSEVCIGDRLAHRVLERHQAALADPRAEEVRRVRVVGEQRQVRARVRQPDQVVLVEQRRSPRQVAREAVAEPVSYTPLTLPTNYPVYISVVAVQLKKKKK